MIILLNNSQKIIRINELLIKALMAQDMISLLDVLAADLSVDAIVEYDINKSGVKLQEEWGNKGALSEYSERIQIDITKEHNKPLNDVINKKRSIFIPSGSKYLKHKGQGSLFLIPNISKNKVRKIYRLEAKKEDDFLVEENIYIFESIILAVVNKKEEIESRELLLDLIEKISSKNTFKERLIEIVKIVDNLWFIDKCAIKMLEKNKLVVKTVSANFGDYFKNSNSIDLEKNLDEESMSVSANAFLSKKTVFVQKVDLSKSKAAQLGICSMLSVPLISDENEVLGVLNVFTEDEYKFSQDQINLIEKFASFAALTMDNILSQEKSLRANERLMTALDDKDVALEELKKTQKKLLRAEKMAVLGEIAVSVNHEINNPLTAIMLSAQVLKSRFKTGHDNYNDVQSMTTTIIDYIYKIQQTLEELNSASKSENIISKEYVSGTTMIDLNKMSKSSSIR